MQSIFPHISKLISYHLCYFPTLWMLNVFTSASSLFQLKVKTIYNAYSDSDWDNDCPHRSAHGIFSSNLASHEYITSYLEVSDGKRYDGLQQYFDSKHNSFDGWRRVVCGGNIVPDAILPGCNGRRSRRHQSVEIPFILELFYILHVFPLCINYRLSLLFAFM